MKYAVDRIENGIVILENIEDKSIKEESVRKLPIGIKEGDVVSYNSFTYVLDKKEKEERIKRISEKMQRLRKVDNELK